jgi:N-acyl-D-amino-acid deacylase
VEILLKNGNVIDGSGEITPYRPWFRADIGIENGRIIKVGELSNTRADLVIDIKNLVVAPGFIDIHSHSDFTLLVNPKAESKIRQGVTTEVVGCCGSSAAPLLGAAKESREELYSSYGIQIDWSTMEEYMRRLEKQGIAVNVAPLVGHSSLRASIMGFENRPPTANEMSEMKTLLADSLESGAWGMSSGLIYAPSCFANIDELIELCKVVAKYKCIYTTHMRGGGDRVIAALTEALETAERSGVSLHIHHHKAMGDRNSAKVLFTLSMIDDSIARGLNITLDMYPYLAGQGDLSAALPPWVREGGLKKLVERLKDPIIRERLKREMVEPTLVPEWESYVAQSGWEECWKGFVIVSCKKEKNKIYEGKSLADAKPDWQDPFDFLFDLLIDEGGSIPFILPDVFTHGDKYLRMVMRHPATMIGSDGYALAPYGALGGGKPHPRSYGTFPRFLGRYVRQERLLSLPEAIRKITSLPAQKLGLKDRGLIREGMCADLVVFDPRRIVDCATFEEPHKYPIGIEYVIVNGEIVIDKGEHTGKLPGKVLRHIT